MSLKTNQRVTVGDKPLFGKQTNLLDGTVMSVEGSTARIHIDGEEVARSFPVSDVRITNDPSVINAIRRI